jgi:hypothetical protein
MFISHILHINTKYAEQNRALLDTLRIHQSNNNRGHIVLYATLLIGHTQHKDHMRVSLWPFVPRKSGVRMDNIWFCKLLLLLKIHTNENYNFLEFSQDFSREKYCVFLFGKFRGCSPGVPRAYPETSTLSH